MISVLVLAAFVGLIGVLTYDRNDLDYRSRDARRAAADRDRRSGSNGVVVP